MKKPKTGVLLLQLGTPDSPSTKDVRVYLSEFLNDPRVIDINPAARLLLVNGIIVPFRAPKSAKLYKEIWTEAGSPLLTYGLEVKEKLSKKLGDEHIVELGMRYRNPSIEKAIDTLLQQQLNKLIIFPLFPQFASSSSGSAIEKALSILNSKEVIPSVEVISEYYNEKGFIDAWADRAKDYDFSKYDKIMFTYHGVPWRHIRKSGCKNSCSDSSNPCTAISKSNYMCYRAQCYATTRAIAERLGIKDYMVSFQSRLGRDPWLTPYTDKTLEKWAKEGVKKVLVFSPSFVADCLETIHEVGTEYNEMFQEEGGELVELIPSLNNSESWINFLFDEIIKRTV